MNEVNSLYVVAGTCVYSATHNRLLLFSKKQLECTHGYKATVISIKHIARSSSSSSFHFLFFFISQPFVIYAEKLMKFSKPPLCFLWPERKKN